MGFFDILANQAANTLPGAVIGTGMGLLLQKNNDRRQLEMQQKLQNMQIAGQQAMTNFNMEKQLQLWKDTSYGAQKEQMKIAGLNPALMYGMGGGGGQTAALAQGNISGGEAPKGRGEIQSMMGISLQSQQLELLQAQKENIKADTEQKKADALLKSENQLKLQYENIINDLLANRDINGKPITDEYDKDGNIIKEGDDSQRIGFQRKVAELKKLNADIGNTEQDTAKKLADIAQGWTRLSLEERKVKVQELLGGEQKDQDQIIQIINTIVGLIERFVPIRIGGAKKTGKKP